MCHKQARIGCAESASYSGTQCLAPKGAKLLRARLSVAFCGVSKAGRVGCAEGASYSGTQCLAPKGAKLLRARLSVAFCGVSKAGRVGCAEGASYSGTQCLAPKGAVLRYLFVPTILYVFPKKKRSFGRKKHKKRAAVNRCPLCACRFCTSYFSCRKELCRNNAKYIFGVCFTLWGTLFLYSKKFFKKLLKKISALSICDTPI